MTHWHVASGLQGYGPDSDDGYATATTARQVAELVRWELDSFADMAHDAAEACAIVGDFEEAWREHKRSESLGTTMLNLDPKRENAPLYLGRPDLWEQTLWTLISQCFGLELSDHSRLYIWQCSEDVCEDDE